MELRDKAEALRRLHQRPDVLILPNAWDVGSARIVEAAGCKAVATTSAGVAWALGYPDGESISRDEMLDMCGRIARAVKIPTTADIEAGYGPKAEDAGETVKRAIAAGIVGGNIEDGKHDADDPLWALDLAIARIRAARKAGEAAGVPFVINARTDSYLNAYRLGRKVGQGEFDETVRRGRAYREAGADCIFIPGLADGDTIRRLCEAIGGPVNILAGPKHPTIPELKALGVRRVSIGGMLALAALGLVRRAAAELTGPGTYGFAAGMVTHPEMNKLSSL